ncbi:MAG: hypothetical protein LC118_09475 [Dehalococcoidia bacterium]|nr:hypothetical protein [Dehalococcoidia bacterium]
MAAGEAGFDIEKATGLDRKQQSHKGYKGRAGDEDVAHFDVVLSMKKSKRRVPRALPVADAETLSGYLDALAREFPHERTSAQFMHSALIRRLAEDGYDLASASYDVVRAFTDGALRRAQ